MEKKDEKTGLAFTDRVSEVAKELQALQQSAPADNKAAIIIISTQHQNGDTMSNTSLLCGDADSLLHAIQTALENRHLKKLFLAAMLAEVIASIENDEEESDE
jgi:hypothetical protein